MKWKRFRIGDFDFSSYADCKDRLEAELMKRYPHEDTIDMLQQLETMAHDVYCSFLYNTIDAWKSYGPITRIAAFYHTLEAHDVCTKKRNEKPIEAMLRETYESFANNPITSQPSPLSDAIEGLCYAAADELHIEEKFQKNHPEYRLEIL